jgi:hypothetical protein
MSLLHVIIIRLIENPILFFAGFVFFAMLWSIAYLYTSNQNAIN